jgi:hypothetical protein
MRGGVFSKNISEKYFVPYKERKEFLETKLVNFSRMLAMLLTKKKVALRFYFTTK